MYIQIHIICEYAYASMLQLRSGFSEHLHSGELERAATASPA